jgi:hypothetical protein
MEQFASLEMIFMILIVSQLLTTALVSRPEKPTDPFARLIIYDRQCISKLPDLVLEDIESLLSIWKSQVILLSESIPSSIINHPRLNYNPL